MELKKQITELKLQDEFRPVIEEFADLTNTLFEDEIHSIYICGSIPKGQAIPYISDVDFTLVFKHDLKSYYMETIQHLKTVLGSKYPIISKVDIASCTVGDVLKRQDEWGFWIKIVSVCIYGNDLGQILEPICITKSLIENLNKETMHVISRILNKLRLTNDEDEVRRLRHALTKRLIRAMFTLILDKVGYWTDDFDLIFDHLYANFPDQEKKIRALNFFLNNEDSSMEEYLATVYGIMMYVQERLENL